MSGQKILSQDPGGRRGQGGCCVETVPTLNIPRIYNDDDDHHHHQNDNNDNSDDDNTNDDDDDNDDGDVTPSRLDPSY